PSVIGRITEVVGSFKASLRSFNVSENYRNGTYEITMRISVPSNMELDFSQAAKYRDEMWALQEYLKVWKD
ncbi:MAG: hypothetical protein K6B16_02170, partial [Bacteroidales bacterium]|nr:hypothetical protein [Bacteroidales bacterium]